MAGQPMTITIIPEGTTSPEIAARAALRAGILAGLAHEEHARKIRGQARRCHDPAKRRELNRRAARIEAEAAAAVAFARADPATGNS